MEEITLGASFGRTVILLISLNVLIVMGYSGINIGPFLAPWLGFLGR
jgi:hypothetical protein